MFEDQLQAVNELLATNPTFKKLHEEHSELREEIDARRHTLDQFTLERMKKQKLLLKDQMAAILTEHSKAS